MGFETIYRQDPFWGSEGVSSDGVSRQMNRTRKELEYRHVKGFEWKFVHDPVCFPREMFGGKSQGILSEV